MVPQIGASLVVVILTTLEVSFMLRVSSITLLENIYTTGVTHYDCHLRLYCFYSIGHHFDDSIGVIYAPRVINYAPGDHL